MVKNKRHTSLRQQRWAKK